jgi:hypothetical protein
LDQPIGAKAGRTKKEAFHPLTDQSTEGKERKRGEQAGQDRQESSTLLPLALQALACHEIQR